MSKTTKVKIKVQPTVAMESEVARKIRQHARSSMKAEVCGVLIGSTENDRTIVNSCIAGVNAAQGGAHVTFTQDTWEHIYKIKDQDYPDDKIVGWYHSHPGFGVFLSEHDLFIQENFFSSPQQIAWVYDPHTDEEGCFGWVNGSIEKLSGIRFAYLQTIVLENARSTAAEDREEDEEATLIHSASAERDQRQGEPAWVRWSSRGLGFLVAALLGATAGYFAGQRQMAGQMDRALNGEFGAVLQQCDQIAQHPVESCRQILQQYSAPATSPSGESPAMVGSQSASPQQPAQKGKSDGKH